MPEAVYDRELASKGKKRIMVGELVEGGGVCYREKVVPINYGASSLFLKKKGRKRMNVDTDVIKDVEAVVSSMVRANKVVKSDKAPRSGSKLSQAVEIVKQTGKDDKESCLVAIVNALGVKRGNATIYFAKAKEILG